MFTDRLKISFPQRITVQSKKVLDVAVNKGDADSLLEHKKVHHYLFPWKRCNYKQNVHGGARGVMVIVVGIGHDDMSSNPGRDWLHFT